VNIVTFRKWKQNVLTMFVSNSSFSVDNFFLLSGLLASYTFMKQTKTGGVKISFLYISRYYLRRIWRIAPTYWLILIFCVGLTRYFVQGPFISVLSYTQFCAQYYYYNLLFINNFYSNVSVFFKLNLFNIMVCPSCDHRVTNFFHKFYLNLKLVTLEKNYPRIGHAMITSRSFGGYGKRSKTARPLYFKTLINHILMLKKVFWSYMVKQKSEHRKSYFISKTNSFVFLRYLATDMQLYM
jgi:hypothetical protein